MTQGKTVYEDALCYVILPKDAVTTGHLQVFPKKKFETLESLDDETCEHLFFVASYCATGLFEGLQAQGTNIIMNNGKVAGQKHENIYIDVLARYQDDKLGIMWEAKQGDPKKVEEVFNQVKGGTFFVGKEGVKTEKKDDLPKVAKMSGQNYMIDHLNKLP